MDWFSISINYLLWGVILNLGYDLIISYIGKEDLRFNMLERLVFAIIWPIYFIAFIFNFIRTFNDNNNDN